MWKLDDTSLPKTTVAPLRSVRVEYVSDILDVAGLSVHEFSKAPSKDVVDTFCRNCVELTRFGKKARSALSDFLAQNKQQILDHYFLELYNLPSVENDDDFVPDLGDALPKETLLLGVHIVKGGVDVVSLEDVVAAIESEIKDALESMGEDELSASDMRERVIEYILQDVWIADSPIYVSNEAAKVYPELVVKLSRSATLVLKA